MCFKPFSEFSHLAHLRGALCIEQEHKSSWQTKRWQNKRNALHYYVICIV